jgi:hypothetical protein
MLNIERSIYRNNRNAETIGIMTFAIVTLLILAISINTPSIITLSVTMYKYPQYNNA